MSSNNLLNLPIPVPVAQGGTSNSSLITTPTASTIPAWDSNANLAFNNSLPNVDTYSSPTTINLTNSSSYIQNLYGSTAYTVVLPASPAFGQSFCIINDNNQAAIVNDFSGPNITNIPPLTTAILTYMQFATDNWWVSGFGITQITGDTGYAAGSQINVIAGQSTANCGSTVSFRGDDVFTLTLNVSDANLNTIVGLDAGNTSATSAEFNAGFGQQCLSSNLTGLANCAFGYKSLNALNGGGFNVALGYDSGINYTAGESFNIVIGNSGVASESDTIRIGTIGTQTACYVAGIASVSVSSAQMVTINTSTGQLGSQTIPSSGVPYINQTSDPVTMVANEGNISNYPSTLLHYTPPASCNVGDVFAITGGASGGWTLNLATNSQTMNYGNQVGTTSVSSTNQYDCVEFVCITANTTFIVVNSVGNLTIT